MFNQGIRIQPDWDKAILEKDRSFWYHLFDAGKTHYRKIEINEDTLVSDTPDVDVSVASSKTLCLRDKSRHLQSTFQSPDFRFSTVHKQTRESPLHLNDFDVNASGELAVSSTSDGDVLLWETKTSEVRRKFVGEHVGDVYVSRFFPSGLVVLTGGADLHLRVWCARTGRCAAALRPGGSNHPGGHRAGLVDADFIDRGRAIVALDRGGWLRLWDISTQTAVSAMSVTPRSSSEQTNCAIDDAPLCCVVKRRACASEASEAPEIEGSFPALELSSTVETSAEAVGVADKLVAVGCGGSGGGRVLLFDIASADTRSRGPVAALTLSPNASVSAVAASPSDGVFGEFGLIAGGSNGVISGWDLRSYRTSLFTFEAYKYGVCGLRVVNFAANGDLPAFTTLCSAFRDGRVVVQRLSETGVVPADADGFSRCLELTGPEAEPVCGLRAPNLESPALWTGTYSAQFFGYRKLALRSLFDV